MKIDSRPPTVETCVLDDLRARIRNTRFVDLPQSGGWSLGVDATYFSDLLAAWADSYDWRAVEARVQALPWVLADRGEVPIRAVHQRATAPGAAAVVLLHGWPDSVMRFEKVKAQLRGAPERRFSLTRLAGRLRYPSR